MAYLLLLLALSSYAAATEVSTIDFVKSTNDFYLVTTDGNLELTLDKKFMAQNCKARIKSTVGSLKEFHFPRPCRALIVQFLLDAGYKADDRFMTFTK